MSSVFSSSDFSAFGALASAAGFASVDADTVAVDAAADVEAVAAGAELASDFAAPPDLVFADLAVAIAGA